MNRSSTPRSSSANAGAVVTHDLDYIAECEQRHDAAVAAYSKRVKQVIRQADKSRDPNYRGLTQGDINRELGDDADKVMTAHALRQLNVIEARLIPERYTFREPKVKLVDKHLWGQPAIPPTHYHVDGKAYPERAAYGRRDK